LYWKCISSNTGSINGHLLWAEIPTRLDGDWHTFLNRHYRLRCSLIFYALGQSPGLQLAKWPQYLGSDCGLEAEIPGPIVVCFDISSFFSKYWLHVFMFAWILHNGKFAKTKTAAQSQKTSWGCQSFWKTCPHSLRGTHWSPINYSLSNYCFRWTQKKGSKLDHELDSINYYLIYAHVQEQFVHFFFHNMLLFSLQCPFLQWSLLFSSWLT